MSIFDEARSRIASGASNTVNASRNNQSVFDQARSRISAGQAERTAARQREKHTLLLDKVAGGNKKGPGYSQVELPGVRDNAARKADRQVNRVRSSVDTNSVDGRLAVLYAQLENTAPSGNLNDPTRYNLLQEIRQLEQEKKDAEKAGKVSAVDWLGSKAGQFNRGITGALDVVANAIPIAEGALFGVDKEGTFTGQLLKPLTTATGKLHEWTSGTTDALNQKVDTAIGDNKALKVASDLGGGVITALPNAALAIMSGGTSAPAQLGAQGTGLAATTATALNKLVSNPMFKLSAAQSFGSSFEEAKAAGATDEEALAAAVLTAGANAAVEVGGGIETLPGQLKGADLTSGAKAWNWVKSALDEGKEEVVQGAIQKFVEKGVYDNDKALFSTTDENAVFNPGRMMQEFGAGAAVGGILGGGQLVGDMFLNRGKANDPAAAVTQDVLGENKTAPVIETEAEAASSPMPKISMADFTDRKSEVFNNLEYGDTETQTAITQKTHQDMVASGAVVQIPESTLKQTESYYPDLRGMKKQERTPILKQKISELKSELRKFLNGMKGGTYEFEVNGNILDATLYDTGIREVMEKVSQEKASMLFGSEEIFKNARYLYSTPDYDGDPNVYRWNYFYTPVQIGNETLGVRIAVRDMATPQESQIYNWGIKKDATLGGGGRGQSRIPTDASSVASNIDSSIDANTENVNGSVGDMGAKTSEFKHEVKQSQTAQNTIGQNEARWGIPEDARTGADYDAVTERESLNNARQRIEQDLNGEQEILRQSAVWSNEEVDMGMLILGGLRMKAKESGDWSAYKDWAKVVKQHGVTSGQALQAWAKYTRRTGDGIMQTVSELLELPEVSDKTNVDEVLHTASVYADQFDDAVASRDVQGLLHIIQDTAIERKTKRTWGKKLGGEIDWALKRIAQYAEAEIRSDMNRNGGSMENYEFLRNFAAAGIEDIAGDHVKASAGEMVKTVRRNAMLSKLSTVLRNLVGNGAFDGIDTLARNVSVPLDMLLSNLTGTRSVAVDRGAFSKEGRQGMMDGLAKALLEVGLDVNAEGAESKYGNSSNRTFKMSGNVVSRLLSNWEKYMGYALNVTDEASKGGVDARVQRGLDRLYEQGKIKDDSLRDGGAQEALYRTFQDDSALARMSTKMRDALNEVHAGDVGAGDMLMPFAQVPANLADRAIDYSPAGLAKSAYGLTDVLIKAKKGTLTAVEQAKAVQTLGRNLTGSGLIAIAAAAATKGLIRVVNPGGEDENKDKAAYEKMQGQDRTQFNLSGLMRWMDGGSTDWQNDDVLMSIAFLEPFNAHLTIGALLAEDLEAEGQLTGKTVAMDTVTGALTAIGNLPMFSAFGDAYDAYQYSDKERDGERLLDAGNTLLANEVSSIIPNSVKGIAQGLDPYQRDLYSKDGAWAQTGDQFRAVFDRDSLPIKQDSYGRDMTNEGGVLNFLNTNVLPGQITKYRESDLDKAIQHTYERTGKTSVFPSRKAPEEVNVGGKTVELHKAQQQRYQQIYGQAEQDTRSALYSNVLYGKLDSENELKAHAYAEDYAKQTAKAGLLIGFEPETWVKELKGKSPEEVAEAIVVKTFESLANDKKVYSNKYEGISGLLDTHKINDTVALAMMSDTAVDGYMEYCKKENVSVADYAEVYAYMNKVKDLSKTLDYIDKMDLFKREKIALAQGIHYANPTIIRTDNPVSQEWLLKHGATDEIVEQFSESRKKLYDSYILDKVEMGDYLTIYNFKNTERKNADGEMKKPKQDEVIAEIDKLDISKAEKRNLFLSMDYSAKKIPYWWK